MLTAIVSDLHLGTSSATDIVLLPEVRDRLLGRSPMPTGWCCWGTCWSCASVLSPAVLERAGPFLAALRRGG